MPNHLIINNYFQNFCVSLHLKVYLKQSSKQINEFKLQFQALRWEYQLKFSRMSNFDLAAPKTYTYFILINKKVPKAGRLYLIIKNIFLLRNYSNFRLFWQLYLILRMCVDSAGAALRTRSVCADPTRLHILFYAHPSGCVVLAMHFV